MIDFLFFWEKGKKKRKKKKKGIEKNLPNPKRENNLKIHLMASK